MSLVDSALRNFDSLLSDDIIEVYSNTDGGIWVESANKGLKRTHIQLSAENRNFLIKTVADTTGSLVNSENPSIAAKVDYRGKRIRFQGTIPPVVTSPVFCMRFPSVIRFNLDEYIKQKSLSRDVRKYLRKVINEYRYNIVVAGSTGSGKTTLVNALLSEIENIQTRYYIIEDTTELFVKHQNKVEILINSKYSYLDAVKDSLRYRPDRIIIGELRDGGATLELLKAWNTGHRGGMSTIHANSAMAVIERIKSLCGEVTFRIPDALIFEALDLIIYVEKTKRGHRVKEIREVIGSPSDIRFNKIL